MKFELTKVETVDINQPLAEERQGEVLNIPASEIVAPFNGKHYYIESYGCAMNFSDSEIVASILNDNGYRITKDLEKADAIFLNTCSIREKAEDRIRKRLSDFKKLKKNKKAAKIGVLGCMAERLKDKLLVQEKLVDIVCGPDAYRDLPNLLSDADEGQKAVNVLLSREETYAEINPVRLDGNGVTAFISIMRGCDNMCSFCVVPFTRGRERSRSAFSIIAEAKDLVDKGYKEVTLLGQNVDSYKWTNPETKQTVNFANLLEMTAEVNRDMRVRFSTSHPKDMTDEVLYVIARNENVCNYIHLPVQSGNSRVLDLMNRTYDREWYKGRIDAAKRIIPDCSISSDIICGFCSETEEEHQDTLSIMEYAKYSHSYMYFYSERPGTLAARKYEDDIPENVKKRRLSEVIDLQQKHSLENNQKCVGQTYKVLVEKFSKRSDNDLKGRNDHNRSIVFPKGNAKKGDYVNVKITHCTARSLFGNIVE